MVMDCYNWAVSADLLHCYSGLNKKTLRMPANFAALWKVTEDYLCDIPVARSPRVNIVFICYVMGLIFAHCPLTSEPTACDAIRHQLLFVEPFCVAVPRLETKAQFYNFRVNDCPVKTLLALDSLITLVHASLVAGNYINAKYMNLVCIHRDTKVYPIALVKDETGLGTVNYEIGVVNNLLPLKRSVEHATTGKLYKYRC